MEPSPEFNESDSSVIIEAASPNFRQHVMEMARPDYISSPDLIFLSRKAKGMNDVDLTEETSEEMPFAGFVRNPVLEEKEIKGISEEIIEPKNIADHNLLEMARLTGLHWEFFLQRIFADAGGKVEIPLQERNGRLSIAIPGSHFGFEIGGILSFFNKQGIPVDIEAVDSDICGQENWAMKLDELLDKQKSTCSFHEKTNAADFFKGKKFDIVILRHPGPVFHPSQREEWRRIVKIMVETEPDFFFLSVYGHELHDFQPEEKLGFVIDDERKVSEYDFFDALLLKCGYSLFPTEESAILMTELLRYPMSIYMTASRPAKEKGKIEWTVPVDRMMACYKKIKM